MFFVIGSVLGGWWDVNSIITTVYCREKLKERLRGGAVRVWLCSCHCVCLFSIFSIFSPVYQQAARVFIDGGDQRNYYCDSGRWDGPIGFVLCLATFKVVAGPRWARPKTWTRTQAREEGKGRELNPFNISLESLSITRDGLSLTQRPNA